MKKYKNNKINIFSTMRFNFILVFMFLLGISSVNSATLGVDLTLNEQVYQDSDFTVIEDIIIFGNVDEQYITTENLTIDYDLQRFYSYVSDDIYVIYNSKTDNETFQIILTEQVTPSDFFPTKYTITVDSIGKQYYKISPDFKGENIRLEVNVTNSSYVDVLTIGVVTNEVVESANAITNTFVGAMKDLIDVNISIWKILYYVFVTVIIILGVLLLFYTANKIYQKSHDLNNESKKDYQHSKR